MKTFQKPTRKLPKAFQQLVKNLPNNCQQVVFFLGVVGKIKEAIFFFGLSCAFSLVLRRFSLGFYKRRISKHTFQVFFASVFLGFSWFSIVSSLDFYYKGSISKHTLQAFCCWFFFVFFVAFPLFFFGFLQGKDFQTYLPGSFFFGFWIFTREGFPAIHKVQQQLKIQTHPRTYNKRK